MESRRFPRGLLFYWAVIILIVVVCLIFINKHRTQLDKIFIQSSIKRHYAIDKVHYGGDLPNDKEDNPAHADVSTAGDCANLIVTSNHVGSRLGNQIFIHACVLGIALSNGVRRQNFEAKEDLSRIFPNTRTRTPRPQERKHRKNFGVKHFHNYTQNYNSYLVTKAIRERTNNCTMEHASVSFNGYLQSWKYFHPQFENVIRREFEFHIELRAVAKSFLEKAMEGMGHDVTLVAIHVRRGDKLILRKWQTAPSTYFLNAMRYFSTRYRNILFVVCSDDIPWSKKTLASSKYKTVFSTGHSGPEDLCILSLCNHTIMSIGTFGWWGGYLAGGQVVYYKYPYAIIEDYKFYKLHNLHDYYLPEWIAMT